MSALGGAVTGNTPHPGSNTPLCTSIMNYLPIIAGFIFFLHTVIHSFICKLKTLALQNRLDHCQCKWLRKIVQWAEFHLSETPSRDKFNPNHLHGLLSTSSSHLMSNSDWVLLDLSQGCVYKSYVIIRSLILLLNKKGRIRDCDVSCDGQTSL